MITNCDGKYIKPKSHDPNGKYEYNKVSEISKIWANAIRSAKNAAEEILFLASHGQITMFWEPLRKDFIQLRELSDKLSGQLLVPMIHEKEDSQE